MAVLALWSFGIVVAQRCGRTTVAAMLASLLDRSEASVRAQLRDWYREASHNSGAKRGTKRRTLVVAPCCAPWFRQAKALVMDLLHRVKVDTYWDAFSVGSSGTPRRGSA